MITKVKFVPTGQKLYSRLISRGSTCPANFIWQVFRCPMYGRPKLSLLKKRKKRNVGNTYRPMPAMLTMLAVVNKINYNNSILIWWFSKPMPCSLLQFLGMGKSHIRIVWKNNIELQGVWVVVFKLLPFQSSQKLNQHNHFGSFGQNSLLIISNLRHVLMW